MASTGEVWKLGHRPALDGVRGIAVLLVILCHTDVPGIAAMGIVGVTTFFALSGFLITALLLEERDRSGSVDFRAFYVRRARRLFPALLAMLGVTGAYAASLGWSLKPLVPVLAYVGNWSQAAGGAPLGVWSHTWSLAVEEQFYLLWPIVLVALLARWGRGAVLAACVGGAVYSIVGRVVAWDVVGAERSYFGTDMRLDGILLGAGLAALLVGSARRVWQVPAGVAVAGVLLLGFAGDGYSAFVVMPGVAAVLSVLLLAAAAQRAPVWLGWAPLALLGRRSYGLYLWHYPMLFLCRDLAPGAPVRATLVGLVLTVVFAELSWRCVERPFLRARSVGAVEASEGEPDQGVVLPGERLHLGGDLRVRG